MGKGGFFNLYTVAPQLIFLSSLCFPLAVAVHKNRHLNMCTFFVLSAFRLLSSHIYLLVIHIQGEENCLTVHFAFVSTERSVLLRIVFFSSPGCIIFFLQVKSLKFATEAAITILRQAAYFAFWAPTGHWFFCVLRQCCGSGSARIGQLSARF